MTKTLKNSYTYKRSKIRSINRALYKEICRNYGYKCAICGWSVPSHTPNGGLQKQNGCELHHIIAYKDKGSESKENLILLCPNCHKLADLGVITQDELRSYIKTEPPKGIDWLKQNYAHLYNK